MSLPGNGSTSAGTSGSNNFKVDVDQLIKEYDPEVGLAKFMADHIKIPVRVSKNSVAMAQSPLKRCKNPVSSLKTKHRYFQQPGQVHNRDRCDACLGIGNIICCDTCPASFHLTCFDPPINEENLGKVWHCRECSNCSINVNEISIDFPFLPVEPTDTAPLSKSPSVSPVKSEIEEKQTETVCESMYDAIKHGRNRRRRLLEMSANESPSKKLKNGMSDSREVDATLHQILKILKVHCLKLNPKTFDLPRDYCTYEPLLGSSWYNQRDFELTVERIPRSETKQPLCVDSENYVPSTSAIRLCYECSKSCALSPLISCDYCQTDFHLECVDPPLTCLPQGRWMCPLHPHFHKRNLLLSSSWSTRVKYHERFSATLIPEDVKRTFLRNISKQHPPWCVKVDSPKLTCEVPQSIKDMYKYPAWRVASTMNMSIANSLIQSDSESSQPCAEVKEEGCVTSNAGFSKNCQNLYRGLLKLVARTHQMETVSSSTQPSNRISVSNVFTPVTDLTLRVDEAFEKLTFSRFERPPCAVAATFCLNTKELTFMTENCLVFGTDSNCCDVVMDRKVCSQLSSKHAVLFFDAISNCFEILNYSQYGMVIDGKRLGVELHNLERRNRYMSPLDAYSCPTDAIRDFMKVRKRVSLNSDLTLLKKNKHNRSRSVRCSCDGSIVSGWEGSAVVNHGSIMSMGCFEFVFVVL